MVATPIGSLLATLWLSQADDVGWWWNSPSEIETAAKFASAGILFYTAAFAALETGVMFMVLAYHVMKKFEADREKRRQELINQGMASGMALGEASGMALGIALGAEAERQRQETGESLEQAIERLRSEGWQPPQS